MEELVIDEYCKVRGETFGEMPFDDFMELVENVEYGNSIIPISKNRYLIKIYGESFYLSTDNLDGTHYIYSGAEDFCGIEAEPVKYKKEQKRLKEACKLSKSANEVQENFGLRKIDKPRLDALMKDNKGKRIKGLKKIVGGSLHSVLRIIESVFCLGGFPALIYGIVFPKTLILLFPYFFTSLVFDCILITNIAELDMKWSDIIKPFRRLFDAIKEQSVNRHEYKLLKYSSKKMMDKKELNAPAPELKIEEENSQIKLDDEIEQIMQRVKELDENDRRAILGELKPIVEKYALKISKLKPGFGYRKDSLDIAKEFAGDILSIENKVSLLIRRNNLEKVIRTIPEQEEIAIERQEGPVRRLTPQN